MILERRECLCLRVPLLSSLLAEMFKLVGDVPDHLGYNISGRIRINKYEHPHRAGIIVLAFLEIKDILQMCPGHKCSDGNIEISKFK